MKKLALLLITLTMACGMAVAADVQQLDGKVFNTTYNEIQYQLTFVQGPFGPGETGTVTLTDDAELVMDMNYQFEDPFCMIEYSLRFVLIDNQLLYIPADTLTFTEQE